MLVRNRAKPLENTRSICSHPYIVGVSVACVVNINPVRHITAPGGPQYAFNIAYKPADMPPAAHSCRPFSPGGRIELAK